MPLLCHQYNLYSSYGQSLLGFVIGAIFKILNLISSQEYKPLSMLHNINSPVLVEVPKRAGYFFQCLTTHSLQTLMSMLPPDRQCPAISQLIPSHLF